MRLELEETLRQIVAGLVGSAVFLLAFFQLELALWAAAALALLGYLAFLVAVARRAAPEARMAAPDVSEQELRQARALLADSAERLRRVGLGASRVDGATFAKMAEILDRIEAHHAADPGDVRHTRRFLRHDLPRLVDTVETYAALSARADAGSADRIAELSRRIAAMTPALERIDQACLENDFLRLEVETEVLSDQLGRR